LCGDTVIALCVQAGVGGKWAAERGVCFERHSS
jgi:hypothetical protein